MTTQPGIVMAAVHRAFPKIPLAPNAEAGNQLPGFFALAFRAFATIWIRIARDLFKLQLARFAKELVQGHILIVA